jgi:type IV pilus assembly protein PilN
MRLDLNLASQPYQDVRTFLLRWGTATTALALFTLFLAGTAVAGWWGSRDVRQNMVNATRQMQELDRDKAAAEALLSQPQNRATLERSRFVNGLIARKAFSWTQLFMDLEKIMPPRVRVVSLQPEAGSEGHSSLRLMVESDSRERALDLVRRMEQSERFRLARLKSERGKEDSGNIQLEIIALYAPEARGGAQ